LNEYLTLIKSLEYMKAARPFVAFDLKETRFIAGESALLARDLPEYVQHILRLLDRPEEARTMGRQGQKRIEDGFLWEHQVPQLLKLYEQVIRSGSDE
jgi:glycosyltransferase involved in cell wall biosynthesis